VTNRVRVSATFSFRGETHNPAMVLDLDRFLAEEKRLEDLYPMLAAANGIGPYSYEYEVLEMAPLHFDQPEGAVAAHLHDGRLDLAGLRTAIRRERLRQQLEEIAKKQLNLAALDEIPGLETALLAAWKLGRNSKR
jgi:hypothetical protein